MPKHGHLACPAGSPLHLFSPSAPKCPPALPPGPRPPPIRPPDAPPTPPPQPQPTCTTVSMNILARYFSSRLTTVNSDSRAGRASAYASTLRSTSPNATAPPRGVAGLRGAGSVRLGVAT
jgi:hypothetical protein